MAELHILGKYTPYGATQVPPRADGSNKYFLFASEGGSKLDHEEEIYFCGKTVIWSSGQTVKKSFTLEHDIIQVVWTTFVPNSPRTDLCVLHTGTPQPSFSFHILTKSFLGIDFCCFGCFDPHSAASLHKLVWRPFCRLVPRG
jgi:hypothetical protein